MADPGQWPVGFSSTGTWDVVSPSPMAHPTPGLSGTDLPVRPAASPRGHLVPASLGSPGGRLHGRRGPVSRLGLLCHKKLLMARFPLSQTHRRPRLGPAKHQRGEGTRLGLAEAASKPSFVWSAPEFLLSHVEARLWGWTGASPFLSSLPSLPS